MSGIVPYKQKFLGGSIERSLAIVHGKPAILNGGVQPWEPDFASVRPVARRRVDLLRYCSLDGKLWAAVYQLKTGGGYEYSASIVVTSTIYREQYECQEAIIWDKKWIGEETCALCGVTSLGPFRCGERTCRKLMCAGRSTGRYFRCFCGLEGLAQYGPFEHVGFAPRRMS